MEKGFLFRKKVIYEYVLCIKQFSGNSIHFKWQIIMKYRHAYGRHRGEL
jgi:hypothetical protein